MYSFLHVPVQAGSDKVLYDMRREYTVADFEKVVNFLSEKYDYHDLSPAFKLCGLFQF